MSPEFESLGSIAGAVAAVGLLLVGASGLGGLLVPRHGRGRGPALDVFLLQIALGLNLLAAVGLCLGMTKWLAGGRSLWLMVGCAMLSLAGWWRGRGAIARK